MATKRVLSTLQEVPLKREKIMDSGTNVETDTKISIPKLKEMGVLYQLETAMAPRAVDKYGIKIDNYDAQSANLYEIASDIDTYKKENCTNRLFACSLNDEAIGRIVRVLLNVIPKYFSGLTAKTIGKGKIISKGTFGYGFKAGERLIKIITCDTSAKVFADEVKNLVLLNDKRYFIKTYGFIFNDKRFNLEDLPMVHNVTDTRKYDYINGMYVLDVYSISMDETYFKQDKTVIMRSGEPCESFIIQEAAESNLQISRLNLGDISRDITRKNLFYTHYCNAFKEFQNLFEVHKSYEKYLLNNGVFIHSDIKLPNMVIMKNNEIKIIDLGAGFFSRTFFNSPEAFSYHLDLLDGPDFPLRMVSPLYDMYCLTYTFFEYVTGIEHRYDSNIYDFVTEAYAKISGIHSTFQCDKEISKNKIDKMLAFILICKLFQDNVKRKTREYIIANERVLGMGVNDKNLLEPYINGSPTDEEKLEKNRYLRHLINAKFLKMENLYDYVFSELAEQSERINENIKNYIAEILSAYLKWNENVKKIPESKKGILEFISRNAKLDGHLKGKAVKILEKNDRDGQHTFNGLLSDYIDFRHLFDVCVLEKI